MIPKQISEESSQTMPKVSVCLTSYNHAKYISKAIMSVLKQTFVDFELLILEHASTDNSLEIIKSFDDKRIRLIVWENNYHSTFAANFLISQAQGKYFAFLCSDDAWCPEKLQKQVDFLDSHENIAAVFTRIHSVDSEFNKFDHETPYDYYFNSQENRSRFKWLNFCFDFQFNPFCCSSVLLRSDALSECGKFDIRSRNMQDFIMWVSILLKYDVHIIYEKLTFMTYHVANTNITGNTLAHNIIVCNESQILYKLLFTEIGDIRTLLSIFPEVGNLFTYLNNDDINFYMALYGLRATRVDLRSFSLNILYDLMLSEENRNRYNMLYGFSHLDLYSISETIDVYGQGSSASKGNYYLSAPQVFCEILAQKLKKIKLFFVASLLFKPIEVWMKKNKYY